MFHNYRGLLCYFYVVLVSAFSIFEIRALHKPKDSGEFRHLYMKNSPSTSDTTLKFPLIQLIENKQISSEIICTESIDQCLSTLDVVVRGKLLSKNVSRTRATFSTMYDDEMLSNTIDRCRHELIVLILSRLGCLRCAELEDRLSSEAWLPASESLHIFKADESYVPEYMTSLLKRLSGRTQDESLFCAQCHGRGIVNCHECGGSGYVMNGSLAAFCSSCLGKKIVRCQACGGKCTVC